MTESIVNLEYLRASAVYLYRGNHVILGQLWRGKLPKRWVLSDYSTPIRKLYNKSGHLKERMIK